MPALVSNVLSDSIAEELDIQKGDIILSIDGVKMQDMIDYQILVTILKYYSCQHGELI